MSLDPQAQALLDQFAEMGRPPIHSLTPARARIAAMGFKQLGGPPEEVGRVDYRFVPGPSADLPAWIYYPQGASDAPLPAVIYLHGGGWVMANIDNTDSLQRSLANQSGCAVIAVNYQKAPEHKFPTPFDDCYAAVEWVFANAEELGIDPARIAIMGDSAGGNLAAAVTLKARDESGPGLAFQVLVYPVTDYGWDTRSYQDYGSGYLLERESMIYYWTHYVSDPQDAEHSYCSPLRAADHSGLPPALIVNARFDPLLDEGRAYAERLEAAGVAVDYSLYEGMIHGFLWFSGVLDESRAVVAEISARLRDALA